jgi:hypothetical protein
MFKKIVMSGAVCLLLTAWSVKAEERFGLQVYPGAKSDAATAKFCSNLDPSGKKAQCFRTGDDFAKVNAFYEGQASLELTAFGKSMPPDMRAKQLTGPKKVSEFCRKGASEMCGFAELPAVRIVSPWTLTKNISPAAPLDKYEHKDIVIAITSN